jgi:hypothetical protein
MAGKTVPLEKDEDLFYGHLSDYLDDTLPSDVANRYSKLLEIETYKAALEKYSSNRGKLQVKVRPLALNEDEYLKIRENIQDNAARQSIEAVRINQIDRSQKVAKLRRSLVITAIILGFFYSVYAILTPEKKARFDALQYLGYEALTMAQHPEGRIDLPSNSLSDVQDYFNSSPVFDHKPQILRPAAGWKIDGASIIDYELVKVAVVQYTDGKSGEKLFQFAYVGQLTDLPRAEPGDFMGIKYHAYTSDRINLIAWQQSEQVVSFLASRMAAETMAQFVKQGIDAMDRIKAPAP